MTTYHPDLATLRARFTHWAIVYDPFGRRWVAIYGKKIFVTADTAAELARYLSWLSTPT